PWVTQRARGSDSIAVPVPGRSTCRDIVERDGLNGLTTWADFDLLLPGDCPAQEEMMKLLLPNTMALQPELPPGWNAATGDAESAIPPEHADAEALVLWGASERHIRSAAQSMHSLRFIQALSAGVDQILAADFDEDVIVASGAGLHSRTVSEHTVALVLALVRRMPEM